MRAPRIARSDPSVAGAGETCLTDTDRYPHGDKLVPTDSLTIGRPGTHTRCLAEMITTGATGTWRRYPRRRSNP